MATNIAAVRASGQGPGTATKARERLATSLVAMLADAQMLMVKTQGVHWNVVGPLFVSIHQLTERQYRDLFDAIDDLAERIRALGAPAPASLSEMVAHSVINEAVGTPTAEQMVEALMRDHETVAARLRETVAVADDLGDAATADLLTERLRVHEQAAWMLRATVAA